MGLFSRKKKEPIVHPDRVRRIHVAAPPDAVNARLDEYDEIAPGGEPVDIATASAGGWTTIVIEGRIHPWAFHNLALWLADLPDSRLVAVVDSSDGERGYWLVDDEQDSWLSGYDDTGTAWSVQVPDNAMVHGDELAFPPLTITQALVDREVPTDLHRTHGDERRTVRLEDPGHDMNPRNDTSFASRKKIRDAGAHWI